MSSSSPAADLVAIADRARSQADELRTISAQIAVVSATTRWQSAAAAAFRDRVRSTAQALRAAANGLDDAADVVERHAARLEVGR
jgi:uncharacterized protein YukE